jgi:hypothetical protein
LLTEGGKLRASGSKERVVKIVVGQERAEHRYEDESPKRD